MKAPDSKRRRLAAWIAVAVAIVAAVAWWLRPAAVPVEAGAVTRGPFAQYAEEQARTRVEDHYVVSAPLAGYVERIALTEGDAVQRGQPIAALRPADPALLDTRTRAELQARYEAARAAAVRAQVAVEAANVELARARADSARLESLAARRLAAEQQALDAKLVVALRERESAAMSEAAHVARHEVDLARAALQRNATGSGDSRPWVLNSPVDGYVLRVQQQSEGVVATGTPLLEIADLRRLEVLVELPTQEAALVQAGAPVELTGWGGPPLAGRVRRVEPLAFTKISVLGVEEQRVNVHVDLLTPEADRRGLGEGYRLDARIRTYSTPDAVLVPTAALYGDEAGWHVYVVQDGRARQRDVRIGHRDRDRAEVLAGVKPGESVIVYPGDSIRDGVRIAVAPAR
jgi:HlyD family secretion protein